MRVWRSWSDMSRNLHRSTMLRACLIWRCSKQESIGWSIQNWIWRRWRWIGTRSSWWSEEIKLILPTSWKLYPKQQDSHLWRGQNAPEQMLLEIAENFRTIFKLRLSPHTNQSMESRVQNYSNLSYHLRSEITWTDLDWDSSESEDAEIFWERAQNQQGALFHLRTEVSTGSPDDTELLWGLLLAQSLL